MRPKRILILSALLLIVIGLTSCSHKLPLPSSREEGILVIAHEALNNTERNWYAFRYLLSHSPGTDQKIKIWPEANSLFIYKNFPVGKYQIDAITLFPIQHRSIRVLQGVQTYPLYGPSTTSFEIKPNHITLLDKKFIVSKDGTDPNYFSQRHKFKTLNEQDKKKIIKKLAEYENADSWILPKP